MYRGIAPDCDIVAIKILDRGGKGNSFDALIGIQWLLDNREKYNIKVANLSIGTQDIGIKDPLVKAVEAAWDRGIIVTIAAGNNGPLEGSVTSPGISRKVITVGACDDEEGVNIWGKTLQNFSGRGPTSECIIKPDVVAPGSNIVSCLAPEVLLDSAFKKVPPCYVSMSGTSMSTPIVTGSMALLLQKDSNLTPDQAKLRLRDTCVRLPNIPQNKQGWGLIDIERLLEVE